MLIDAGVWLSNHKLTFWFQNAQYRYYGTGLLSNYDKFPENQDSVTGGSREGDSSSIRRNEIKVEAMRGRRGRKTLKKEDSFNDSLVSTFVSLRTPTHQFLLLN